jgi:RNA polymerase sigma-70 factor (ECF subfamily)
VNAEENTKLHSEEVASLYATYAEGLVRFLLGVLRDEASAQDVLHTSFARLIEQGNLVNRERRKAWLYQVAFREALVVKRKLKTRQRHQQAVWNCSLARQELTQPDFSSGAIPLIQEEKVVAVRTAISTLSEKQQQILLRRIYENKTFAEISKELDIPLGTALARMQTALKKLKVVLAEHAKD